MNKTQAAFAAELEKWKREYSRETGRYRIDDYRFQGVRLRLVDWTTYTPDFMTRGPDGLTAYEVEARRRDRKSQWSTDTEFKIRVAAEQFRGWINFVVVRPDGQGGWESEEF